MKGQRGDAIAALWRCMSHATAPRSITWVWGLIYQHRIAKLDGCFPSRRLLARVVRFGMKGSALHIGPANRVTAA